MTRDTTPRQRLIALAGCIVLPAILAATQAGAGPLSSAAGCTAPAAGQALPALPRLAARLAGQGAIRILAIGSSSTEGAGASSPAASYPSRLELELEPRLRRANVDVENAGIGGETADQTVQRLVRMVAERRFDLVIWQVGTNDAVRSGSEESFLARLRQGIAAVKASGADLLLMDQQYLDRVADPPRYRRFVDAVAAEARAEGVPLFSRYAAMRLWAGSGTGGLGALLAPDGFHLNDRGYACLARDLAASIAGPLAGTPVFAHSRAL